MHLFGFTCGVPLYPQVRWPPVHEDKGAETTTESFAWPVNTMEIASQESNSVRQISFIPGYRGYIGLGMIAGQSTNFH